MQQKEKGNLKKIQYQIEYYFSDHNLRHDAFFNVLIRNAPNGYQDIKYLMKCNKLKKLKATEAMILQAVNLSYNQELSPSKDGVRSSGLEMLPLLNELAELPTKKLKQVQEAIEIIRQKEISGNIFV